MFPEDIACLLAISDLQSSLAYAGDKNPHTKTCLSVHFIEAVLAKISFLNFLFSWENYLFYCSICLDLYFILLLLRKTKVE
jgi:hypothetical protein